VLSPIAWRSPPRHCGPWEQSAQDDPQIWAYIRTTPNARLLVIANCGRDPRTVEIGREWIGAKLLLGNLSDTPTISMSSSVALPGWDARIYLLAGGS
jgi:oligo-1,6-glucosidase